MSGSTLLSSGTVPISGGTARLRRSAFVFWEMDNITAVYNNGDATHAYSASPSLATQIVSQGQTSSPSPPLYHPPSILPRRSSPASPSRRRSRPFTLRGPVSFMSGSTLLSSGTVPISGGTATYTTSGLFALGSYNITAVCNGDANYAACPRTSLRSRRV